jgi:mRNA-degrading endonuclease RelE of RelBE toxin-antitoxin system
MVTVAYTKGFEETMKKIRDHGTKERLKRQIIKIVNNPDVGKPGRYSRKDTREVYVPPFRVSYYYNREKDILVFLAPYHKNAQ